MTVSTSELSTQEWEDRLGADVRRTRLRQGLTQEELARQAGVSLSALKSLEAGRGTQLRTLVRVARVLGRDEWLASFAPPEPSVSPMQLLRDQQRQAGRTRQRAPRRSTGPAQP
jgi:transcriptional regulator with XRE-family HTH domain